MGFRKLQIKRLSNNGELLRCINCHAGQITVLRATASSELTPFQRALAGVPGAERFSLTLDGRPFEPSNHSLVGYGESFPQADTTTVQFLTNMGVLEGQANSLLISYGLDSVLHAKCSELSEDQSRRLRIIAATTREDKILIINNPFEVINSQWRERVAELLTSFVRQKKQIVVIPSLTFRPQHWIDNETISRMQVGENIQKTIGFASGSSDVMDLIKEVRKDFAGDPSADLSAVNPPRAQEPPPQRQASKPDMKPSLDDTHVSTSMSAHQLPQPGRDFGFRNLLLSLIVGVLIGVSVYGWWFIDDKPPTIATRIPAKAVEQKTTKENNPQFKVEKTTAQQPEVVKVKKPTLTSIPVKPRTIKEMPNAPPTGVEYAIDLYPRRIKAAILLAFDDGSKTPAGLRSERTKVTKGSLTKSPHNLFSMLESVSGSGEHLPDRKVTRSKTVSKSFNKTSKLSDTDIEKRRELIRKKFLEAIERHKDRE